jgi:hypothetical protein
MSVLKALRTYNTDKSSHYFFNLIYHIWHNDAGHESRPKKFSDMETLSELPVVPEWLLETFDLP